MGSAQSNPSSKWADLRDFCSAIREVVIVAAMLSLLIVPSVVRQVLERAGIRSVAGVEFDVEDIAQSREELDAALVQINSLKHQLASAQQQVQGLADSSSSGSNGPGGSGVPNALSVPFSSANGGGAMARNSASGSPSPSFASVSRLLASMKSQAEETDQSLRRSRVHTDKFLEQAGNKIQLTPPDVLFRQSNLPETPDSDDDDPAIMNR